jgi:bifunctional non-homologous end joining protein LigD
MSLRSGLNLQPRFIEPMECKHVAKLAEGEAWRYEIKQDGYRAIGLVDGNSAMLYSISGQDYSSKFPQITFAMKTQSVPSSIRRSQTDPATV